MTSQAFRLKLTRVNQLKLKVNARIPAVITAQSPIALDKTNGVYALSFDADAISGNFATAAQGALADSAVQSVVAGSNVTVDNTDPRNPVVSASGGGGGGSGDVTGPSSSVDSEIALFSSTTGKVIKRASTSGILKGTSGVLSAATAGTDYLAPPSGTAMLKANSGGALANAVAGTDYYDPGGTDVAVADGGTGASNASGARTNLGLVIGTDVQAYDTDLAALAANSTNGLWAITGSGTGAARTITGTANEITITNGDGVSGNPTASLPSALTFSGKTVTGGSFSSPSLTTPTLGAATATSINKVTITAPATSATLTIPDGVTLTGPAASGTAMTLGNTETVTGVKSFISSALRLNGSTSGTTTLNAAAIAGTTTLTLPAATDTLVGRATTDTLTNKTLTSPAITTPTGIVKGDVGLGNVDNTSDTTKNSATATLTNKTLTDPLISRVIGGTGTGSSLDLQSTSGVGATDYIRALVGNNGATEAWRTVSSGNTGFGTNVPSSKVVINGNTTQAQPTPGAGTVLHFMGADGGSAGMQSDGFGGSGVWYVRRANNTAASPSGITSGQSIFQFLANAYHSGGAYSTGNPAALQIMASETWSLTANGTKIVFGTTPNGSTTRTSTLVAQNSGGISVGVDSDPGAGLIKINSASFLMVNNVSWNNGAAASTGTLTNAPSAGNPTKWIPISDNGTTRYIPAW